MRCGEAEHSACARASYESQTDLALTLTESIRGRGPWTTSLIIQSLSFLDCIFAVIVLNIKESVCKVHSIVLDWHTEVINYQAWNY